MIPFLVILFIIIFFFSRSSNNNEFKEITPPIKPRFPPKGSCDICGRTDSKYKWTSKLYTDKQFCTKTCVNKYHKLMEKPICHFCKNRHGYKVWKSNTGKEFGSKKCLDDSLSGKLFSQISNEVGKKHRPIIDYSYTYPNEKIKIIPEEIKNKIIENLNEEFSDHKDLLNDYLPDYLNYYLSYKNLKRKNIPFIDMEKIRGSIDRYYKIQKDEYNYEEKLWALRDGDKGIKSYHKFNNFKNSKVSDDFISNLKNKIENNYSNDTYDKKLYQLKDEILYETIYTPEFARKHINKRISNGNFPSIVRKKLFGILDALLTECDGKYWKDRLDGPYVNDVISDFENSHKEFISDDVVRYSFYIPKETNYLDFKWVKKSKTINKKNREYLIEINQQIFFNVIVLESFLNGKSNIGLKELESYIDSLDIKLINKYKCYYLLEILYVITGDYINYFRLSKTKLSNPEGTQINSRSKIKYQDFTLYLKLANKKTLDKNDCQNIMKLVIPSESWSYRVDELYDGYNDDILNELQKLVNKNISRLYDLLKPSIVNSNNLFIEQLLYHSVGFYEIDFEWYNEHCGERPQMQNNKLIYNELFYGSFLCRKASEKIDYRLINRKNIPQEYILYCQSIHREAVNNVRVENNLPKIGEGWISETKLYNKVKDKFSKYTVLHDKGTTWLKPQRLDVYIVELNIGFEYQGEQHQQPIDFFGGEETFKKTVERDTKKKKLCEENNCKLIYIYPDESEDEINKKIEDVYNESLQTHY